MNMRNSSSGWTLPGIFLVHNFFMILRLFFGFNFLKFPAFPGLVPLWSRNFLHFLEKIFHRLRSLLKLLSFSATLFPFFSVIILKIFNGFTHIFYFDYYYSKSHVQISVCSDGGGVYILTWPFTVFPLQGRDRQCRLLHCDFSQGLLLRNPIFLFPWKTQKEDLKCSTKLTNRLCFFVRLTGR